MSETSIEWTHRAGTVGETWNPSTGCDRISAGSDNCYPMTLAKRLKAMGQAKYQTDGDPRTSGPGFGLALHPDTLTNPLRWPKARTPQHTYQILTKRPERMARVVGDDFGGGQALLSELMDEVAALTLYEQPWPLENVWLGTSIESEEHVRRADHLRATSAAVRFVSAEPLLGPLYGLDLTGIDWLIIGGESGPGSRPMDLGWVRDLIGLARQSATAVFVKQMGSVLSGGGKGTDWSRWPEDLRISEYPSDVREVRSEERR